MEKLTRYTIKCSFCKITVSINAKSAREAMQKAKKFEWFYHNNDCPARKFTISENKMKRGLKWKIKKKAVNI